MSFSGRIKTELILNLNQSKLSYFYFLSGLLCFNKDFVKNGKLVTLNKKDVATTLADIIQSKEKIDSIIIKKQRNAYTATVNKKEDILYLNKKYILNLNPCQINNKQKNTSSFIAGAFVYCGNTSHPLKEYHIDFSIDGSLDAKTFCDLLRSHNIPARLSHRNEINTVYLKESENIEDILTLMSASNTSLALMNVKIYKQMRNNVNRITNCETANLDKTVDASTRQVRDIEYLKNIGVFNKLEDTLRKTAQLRIEYPYMPLEELSDLHGNISKSGLNHRFNKIHKLALSYKNKI